MEKIYAKSLEALGYNLLMILSISDGEYDDSEGRVILKFVEENYGKNLDLDKENEELQNLEPEEISTYFSEVAKAYKERTSPIQKYDFLLFAVELITADGKITEDERKLVVALANNWQIDIEPIFGMKLTV